MRKVGILIRELSDDEDEDDVESSTTPIAPNDLHAPWHKDFNRYLNSKDQLGNMTIIEWWGVRISCHLLWQQSYHAIVVERYLV